MIAATNEFTPATDEVWRLQRGSDPECRFFQAMANHGHYGGNEGGTRQGIYVCAPSGKFLASINSNNPDAVLEMMEKGLQAWKDLPAAQRPLSAASEIKPTHRWEDSYPSHGLILTVITRDLPEQCDPREPCEVRWNQDQVWFSAQEARNWLGADPTEGDVHELPAELVARLARFHFVDAVNGQTTPFSSSGVEGSRIRTEVTARSGGRVQLKLSGLTKGVTAAGWWRESSNGVVTRLLGHATYDLEAGRFVDFEIVALGRRWGYTQLNGRRRDPNEGPLGFVFRLSEANTAPIAPAFIRWYDAEWVKNLNRSLN